MTSRKWMSSPVVTLTTEFGPIQATFTDAGHVSAHTDAHINDNKPALTFRDQDYLAHVHLFADADWGLRAGDRGSFQKRPQWTDAPRTHAERMTAAIRDAVRAYVADHPEVLRLAEVVSANNALWELAGERVAAVDALAAVDARIADAEARIAANVEVGA